MSTNRKITIQSTGNSYELNESKGLSDIEQSQPLFFKKSHGKRETHTVYRGQLIVRHTVQFTDSQPERKTTVYLYLYNSDNERWSTLCIGNAENIYYAKKWIDQIIDSSTY